MPCAVEQICVSIPVASFQTKQVLSAGLCGESCWAKSGHEEDFFLPQVPSLSHPSVSPLLHCGGGDLQAVEGGVAEGKGNPRHTEYGGEIEKEGGPERKRTETAKGKKGWRGRQKESSMSVQ